MFGDSSVKKELLRLLDEDADVRRKLRGVLSGSEEGAGLDKSQGKSSYLPFERKNYAAIIEKLKTDLTSERRVREKVESEAEELRRQIETQQCDFEGQKQKLTEEYADLRKAQTTTEEKCRNLEQEIAVKDAALKEAVATNTRLQGEYDRAKGEIATAQAKLADKDKLLAERFGDGWEIFLRYGQLTPDTKESLERVFAHGEDFTSFICCGAQTDAPEVIWDIMSNCWDKKLTRDLAILREVFDYSLALVNSTQSKHLFEILTVKPGDKFDRKYHLVEPFCEVKQGNVGTVCVQGFRNIFANKVIRQSLVSLE